MAMVAEDFEHEVDPDLQKELLQHPGKWVVISGAKIVSVADSAQEAMRSAPKAAVERILYRVFDSDTHYLF